MSVIRKIKYETCGRDGSIAQGKAKCYITINAKRQHYNFIEHEQGDVLNDLWNFLVIACSHTLKLVIKKRNTTLKLVIKKRNTTHITT